MMVKKNKTINFVVITAALFIGIIGCGKDKSENKETEASKNIKTATAKPEKDIVDKKELSEEIYGTINNSIYTATGGALQMSVPDSWRVSEEDATILIAGKEEDTKDCVTIQVAQKDDNFISYQQGDFEDVYNQIFDNLEFEEFKQTKFGNMEAIYMRYSCSKDSTDLIEHQYMLNGDCTYLISFTDVSGKLEKEIDTCMDSVVICK